MVPRLLAVVVVGGILAVDPGGWYSFGPIKWLVLTAGAWAAWALALREGSTFHRYSATGWGIFLLWAAFVSSVGPDPLSGWLGTPDRRLGVVGMATLAVAFLAGQRVTDAGGRGLLARSWVVAGAGLVAYGVAEWLDVAPVGLDLTSPRLGSTLGSPAYLGAALCLCLPAVAGTAVDTGQRPAWRTLAALTAGGGLFLLAGSGTRAAVVGLAAGAGVTAFLWWPVFRRRWFLPAALLLTLAALLVLVPQARRLVEPGATGRLAEWETAVSAIAARPLTGAGLEGYRIVFPSRVGVDYVRAYGRDTVTDRAHAGPLDVAVSTGIAGGLAWLAMVGWLVWRSIRVIRPDDPVLAGMAAGVVAVFVQEALLFPTLEVGVAQWAMAGVVVAASPSGRLLEVRSTALAGSAAVVALLALAGGGADVAADHLAADARQRGSVEAVDRAASLRPDSWRYRLLGADLMLRAGHPGPASLRLEEALALSPRDPALRLSRARVVAALVAEGVMDPAGGEAEVAAMATADPHHPELRLIQGDLLVRRGSPTEAEHAFLAASYLAPRRAEPELRLVSLYRSLGETGLAREALERAREREPDHPAIPDLEDELEDA